MRYGWPYRIVWNFRGVQLSWMVNVYHFTGIIFCDARTCAHYVLYNQTFFAGLISTVKRSSVKRENWTLEIFYAAIIIIIIFYITTCWILKKIKKGEGSGRAWKTTYSEIVSEQLHDESAVLVGVLLKSVQLSNGLVKCLKKQKKQNVYGSKTYIRNLHIYLVRSHTANSSWPWMYGSYTVHVELSERNGSQPDAKTSICTRTHFTAQHKIVHKPWLCVRQFSCWLLPLSINRLSLCLCLLLACDSEGACVHAFLMSNSEIGTWFIKLQSLLSMASF